MFLGILIGMILFGVIMLQSNRAHGIYPAIARSIGWFNILVGICGAIGWCVEVFA